MQLASIITKTSLHENLSFLLRYMKTLKHAFQVGGLILLIRNAIRGKPYELRY